MTVRTKRERDRERRSLYIASLGGQLERIAKIHSPRVTAVNITSQDRATPGWSAEGIIVLNQAALPDPMTVDGLMVWVAVLMHEVGHCQWSPEAAVWEADLRKVANLAEDQREEHLVAAELPGVIPGFRQAVATLILDQIDTPPYQSVDPWMMWPLVAGRLYLSKKVRRVVRDAAIAEKGATWTSTVADLIAKYKRLADPGYSDKDEAERILNTLKAMLPKEQVQLVNIGCNTSGTGNPDVGGVPMDTDEDLDEPEESEEESGGCSGESTGEPTEEEGDEESAGGANDGDSDDESKDDKESKSGAGSDREKIKDAVKKEQQESADDMRQQAKVIMRQVREEIGVTNPETFHLGSYPPSPAALSVKARLEQQLKPLLQAADSGFEFLTDDGEIQPDRIAAGYRPDHVFDKWRLDQHDEVSAEIVVAVDVSGSMGSHMKDLSEAIWVIRQVVGKTSSNLTVLLWDTYVTEYRHPLTSQVPRLSSRGSTDVTAVAKLALEVFTESQARRKWLLVMTDGASTHDEHTVRSLFGAIEKQHVAVTALEFGGIGSNYTKDWGLSDRRHIKSLEQMPVLIGGMLKTVYQKFA